MTFLASLGTSLTGLVWMGLECIVRCLSLVFVFLALRVSSFSFIFLSFRKRQKTRKSRVQEVSRDGSRIIRPQLIAPKHSKTRVVGAFVSWREDLHNSDSFLNPRLPGFLSLPDSFSSHEGGKQQHTERWGVSRQTCLHRPR